MNIHASTRALAGVMQTIPRRFSVYFSHLPLWK